MVVWIVPCMCTEIKTLDVFLPNKIKTLHPSFSIDFTNPLDLSYFPQNNIEVIFLKSKIRPGS